MSRGATGTLLRRLAFASPEIAINLMFSTINTWYLFFLVQIAQLEPVLAGAAFFLGRVADGLFDPVVGHWSDRLAAKGQRKALIGWAVLPTVICFVLIWWLPMLADRAVWKFALATAGFAVFTLGYTFVTLPRLAMLPSFEADYHGRTSQIAFDLVLAFVAIGAAMAGLPALIGVFADGQAMSAAGYGPWTAAIAVLALHAAVAYLPFLLFIRQPPIARQGAANGLAIRHYVQSLRGSELGSLSLIFFLSVVSTVSVQSMLPFFLEIRIGVAPSGHALILGVVFATTIAAFPLWSAISLRIGKRRGLLLGGIVYCVFLGLLPLVPPHVGVTPLLLVVCVIAGAGVSALSLFPWSLMPDVVERHCTAEGARHEGICTAVFTMTNKLAIGTSVLANAALLSTAGGVTALAKDGADAGRMIMFATSLVPMAACLGMLCLAWSARRLDQARTAEGTVTVKNVVLR